MEKGRNANRQTGSFRITVHIIKLGKIKEKSRTKKSQHITIETDIILTNSIKSVFSTQNQVMLLDNFKGFPTQYNLPAIKLQVNTNFA